MFKRLNPESVSLCRRLEHMLARREREPMRELTWKSTLGSDTKWHVKINAKRIKYKLDFVIFEKIR